MSHDIIITRIYWSSSRKKKRRQRAFGSWFCSAENRGEGRCTKTRSSGSCWSESLRGGLVRRPRGGQESLLSTIPRLFLTMKCGSPVLPAARGSSRSISRSARIHASVGRVIRAPFNPRICLTGRLIGDCGRDEARWGALSKSAQGDLAKVVDVRSALCGSLSYKWAARRA